MAGSMSGRKYDFLELNDCFPIAVLIHREGHFYHDYVTRDFERELLSLGFDSLKSAEEYLNNKENKIYEKVYDFAAKCLKSQCTGIHEFVVKNNYFTIRMNCEVDEDEPNVIICKVIILNMTKFMQHSKSEILDRYLKNLISFYECIFCIDEDFSDSQLIYNNNRYVKDLKDFSGSFKDKVKLYAEHCIHPDYVKSYEEYFKAENLKKLFDVDNNNFLISFFRTRVAKNEYAWKAYLLVKVTEDDEIRYFFCIRDVCTATEHILIKDDYVRLFNKLPVPYSIFQVEIDDDENVTDVYCIYASNLVSEIMHVDSETIFGKSILPTFKEKEDVWKDIFKRAAYYGEKAKETVYVPSTGKWITAVVDQAASKGKAAIIFEDVTKEKITTEKLGREWRTDDLIINCIKILHSGLPYEESIESLLATVGEAIGGRRLYILETSDGENFVASFEWRDVGEESSIQRFGKLEKKDLLNWEEEFIGAFNLFIDNVEDLKDSHPRMYSIMREYGINNLIEVPIFDDGQLIGYFGATLHSVNQVIDVRQLIENISYFLSSIMSRKRLIDELEKKSIYDSLCGVKNRNAMELYTKRLLTRRGEIGVLFADANGLKVVNDTLGHEAGDQLLKRMSSMLISAFGRENVYRAGGDEFVVLYSGISEAEFEEKCKALKEDFAKADGIAVALGWAYSETSSEIDEVTKKADKLMYEDKANYYRKNNRRRQRD